MKTKRLDPKFDKNGQYVLKTQRDMLAAAVDTLHSVAIIPQAYHSAALEAQVETMRREATVTLEAILAALQVRS